MILFYLFSSGFGQHWTQHFLFLYCFDRPGCFKPQIWSRNCCRGKWTQMVKTWADLYTFCDLLSSVAVFRAYVLLLCQWYWDQWKSQFLQCYGSQKYGSWNSPLSITQEPVRNAIPRLPRATESEMYFNKPSSWLSCTIGFENPCFSLFPREPWMSVCQWGVGVLMKMNTALAPFSSQMTLLLFKVECCGGCGGNQMMWDLLSLHSASLCCSAIIKSV